MSEVAFMADSVHAVERWAETYGVVFKIEAADERELNPCPLLRTLS